MVLSLKLIQFPSLPQPTPSDLIAFGLHALFPVYQTSYLSNDYKLVLLGPYPELPVFDGT